MSAPIDKIQSSNLAALIPKTGIEQLPQAHQALIVEIKAHIADRASGLDAGDLEFLRQTFAANRGLEPPLSIRDLPLDVVQTILESQAKTMEEFFRSWADSIAKNAKADKKSSERSQRQSEELNRPQALRRLKLIFASTLNRMVQTGKMSPRLAAEYAEQAGLAGALPNPPITPSGWTAVPQRDLQASMLAPPTGKIGFQT